MQDQIDRLKAQVEKHESRLRSMNFNKMFKQIYKRKNLQERQEGTYFGLHLALCVDTRDPWKQNRVRYFSPVLDISPQNDVSGRATKLNQCDWAWPISSMGGFDDCGMTWVPPPGTTLCLQFQNGSAKSAFYHGTTWQRNKGPEDAQNWGFPIPEYDKIFRGHRKGYMVGKNDESQAMPPFNNDNYQGYDFDTSADTDIITTADTETTWPHIYGWKTPDKHTVIMDDGDPKCNRRFKRIEIISSMGHQFLMKDDPYNTCGAWTNPKCRISFTDIVPDICAVQYIPYSNINFPSISRIAAPYTCQQGPEYCSRIPEGSWQTVPLNSSDGTIYGTNAAPVEEEYLGQENFCPIPSTISNVVSSIPVDCMGVIKGLTDFCFTFNNDGKNRYQKHRHECYPYMEGRCGLPQSGMQMLSRGGHGLVMDDSVEIPRERPEWERTLKPFDKDGCSGVYRGRMYLRSSTGHYIEFNDQEVNPKIRGPKNGITIGTACGQYISINDHTEPAGVAGVNRGIHMKSSAEHTFDMVDDGNHQSSPERDGCAKPGAYSKKAFIRLRSGYGIQMLMNDAQNQSKTDQQYFQILSPQKDNLQRGPHVFHMQEKATGSGQVFLRAGGDYVVYSYDNMVEVVGDEKDNPSNKLEFVSNMKIVSVKDVYYNKSKAHVFWAEDHIFLLAGQDLDEGCPTVYPVVVAYQPIPEYIQYMTGMKASEHVFASARVGGITCASDL